MSENERRPCVLVVDDNEINQLVATEALEEFGYESDVVSSGADALARVAERPYAVILMDFRMPGMDGLETSCRLRDLESSLGREPSIIIALTGNAMPGDRERCESAGMNHYLTKPLDLAALEKILHDCLPIATPHED